MVTAMNINKSCWNKVPLSDVVCKKEENDKENAKKNFDRFLKVEHLDAESLHIKRWAEQTTEDLPPTFYKVFRKGQVLFPTRNPHLRRTALASFDGICGEKTLCLEPNSDLVLPGFIPFLFHSEAFYAHTTSSIIGSTNPHVRWRDVANYEFLLPPKDQQAQIADLLWEMDGVIEKEIKLLESLNKYLDTKIEREIHGVDLFGKTINEVLMDVSKKHTLVPLGDLGEIIKGSGIPKADVVADGIPCIRYGELYTKHHRIIRAYHSFVSENLKNKGVRLNKGDVLFAGSGETITEIGKSASFVSDEEAYAGGDILIFRPFKMSPLFSGYLMNSNLVRQQLNKYGTGATVMHIYKNDIEKIQVPDLSLSTQNKIGNILENISSNVFSAEAKINASRSLQKSLINQVF